MSQHTSTLTHVACEGSDSLHVSEVRPGRWFAGRDVEVAHVVFRKPLPIALGIFVGRRELAIFLVHVRRDGAGTGWPIVLVVVAVVVMVDTFVADRRGDTVVRRSEVHAPRVFGRFPTNIARQLVGVVAAAHTKVPAIAVVGLGAVVDARAAPARTVDFKVDAVVVTFKVVAVESCPATAGNVAVCGPLGFAVRHDKIVITVRRAWVIIVDIQAGRRLRCLALFLYQSVDLPVFGIESVAVW